MMIWDTIVGKLLGTLPEEIVGYYKEKRRLENEVVLKKLEGKIAWEQAKTKRAEASEGRDAEWETLSIKNSGWKDEWVLILLSIPLILVFIPYTQPFVMDGFLVLEETPDWYRWLILLIFCAVYGIRVWRRSPGINKVKTPAFLREDGE